MNKTFTSSEVRELAVTMGAMNLPATRDMLRAYADRLEAEEKAQAQPPAASVTDEMIERARSAFVQADDGSTGITDAIRAALLAAHLAYPQPSRDAKDASRYRWLRDKSGRAGSPYIRCDDPPFKPMAYWITAGTADSCIDRAMAKESGNG